MRRMTSICGFSDTGRTISIHILHAEDDVICPKVCLIILDFNPHPPCGGWHGGSIPHGCILGISIHILHAEDDLNDLNANLRPYNFIPHPPCGGWRFWCCSVKWQQRFQSTSSMRRMTTLLALRKGLWPISIHILHAEDDTEVSETFVHWFLFQSTSSMRRMTACAMCILTWYL